jgi:tetratricopeptide (TPR) repeat protein
VRALNAWRLERADSLFGAAVEADSTFALAYYRRALANGFQSKGDAALAARNARALDMAVRHASRLAPRERDLIAAYRELDRGLGAPGTGSMGAPERLAEAERRYAALAARDSTSADAWYGLADARYHMAGHTRDWRVVQRLWNGSLRAFERTIGLDSSFHLAYQHRLDLYTLAAVPGSPMILDGDSLRLLDPTERRAFGEARFQGAKTRAQQLVVRDARAWVASDSAATKAYEALARAFVAAGQPDSAVHVLEAGLASAEARRPVLAYHMAFARAASGDHPGALGELRRALARFPADSLRGTMSPDAFWSVLGGAGVAAAAGAPDDVRRVVVIAAEAMPQMPLPGGATMPTQQLARWFEAGLQLAMGLPSEAPVRVVTRGLPLLDAVPGEGGRKARVMSVGVPYAAYLATGDDRFRATAVAWADTSAFTPLTELEALAAVQRGDTARARTLAAGFPPGAGGFALGGMRQVARAQVWLRLGDVRRAAETLEATDERRVVSREFVDVGRPTFVRSHLLRGQLWERLGDRPRAEAAYQRFLASWRDADAVLDGQRRLAREGLARLRDTRGTRAVPVS